MTTKDVLALVERNKNERGFARWARLDPKAKLTSFGIGLTQFRELAKEKEATALTGEFFAGQRERIAKAIAVKHLTSNRMKDAFGLGDQSMPRRIAALLIALAGPAATGATPDSIPTLRVGDAEGRTTTLNAPGMLYLVDFWALGCKPCILEMPELERLAKEYEPEGRFRLVSVVASGWEGKDLLMVAQQAGTTLPVYSDPDDLFRQPEIRAFPTKLLIRDGKVLRRKRGGGPGAYEIWKKAIDDELRAPSVANPP